MRENTECEYSDIGAHVASSTSEEQVTQTALFTRRGCDRVMRYAFELAEYRRHHVTSATKSNGLIHSMPFWDERFDAIRESFPQVKADKYHIDILCAHFVRHPDWF